MKRVVILSNLDEQCGNAAYGRTLTKYLSLWYDAQMMNSHLFPIHAKSPDVVILNWHPARVSTSAAHVKSLQAAGSKVILILQNSFETEHWVGETDLLAECDAVVAHEPMSIFYKGKPANNFFHIEHGILEVADLHMWEGSVVSMIGTAGFQFPWKRTDVVVKAAKYCGVAARIFCPPYPGFDRNRHIDSWQQLYNNVHVDRNWLSEEQVVKLLSEHVLNIFWFQSQGTDDQFGQTGSARFGLAAKRPMIISRHRKFRTLLPYEDELYVADTEEEVFAMSKEIIDKPSTAKRPNRVLKDMGWSACAEKYRDVIERVCR